MDFGRALTFQFKDPDWIKKILMASLITLIPVVGWIFVFGWSLEIARRVIRDDPQAHMLPEIDLARDMVRGLQSFLISLVYNLPAMAILVPVMILFVFTTTAFGGDRTLDGFFLVTCVCLIPLILAYSVLMTMVITAAYGNFLAQEESFAAGFQLGRIFSLVRKAPLPYFLVVVGQILCSFIAFFGLAACIVGVVVTSTYTLTVMGHLYGQAYKESQRVVS